MADGSLCEYENQRLKRIARNKRVLEELGLVQGWQVVPSKPRIEVSRKLTRKGKAMPQPLRRSKRHITGRHSLSLQELPLSSCEEKKTNRHPPLLLQSPELPTSRSLFAHNLMRLNSMSEEAMIKRIKQIKRKDKMESLIDLLKQTGNGELLQHAIAAHEGLK